MADAGTGATRQLQSVEHDFNIIEFLRTDGL